MIHERQIIGILTLCILASGCADTLDEKEPDDWSFADQRVASLSTGSGYTCALSASGAVSCWGSNTFGELGNGEGGLQADAQPQPVRVKGLETATDLDTGVASACAVLEGGEIRCWGQGIYGQLGNGNAGEGANSFTPVAVEGIDDAVEVSAGGSHSCARLKSGRVACWGSNRHGELGTGTRGPETSSATPKSVQDIDTAVDIATGRFHSCAVLRNGSVKCWGGNERGQLGTSDAGLGADETSPAEVEEIDSATEVVGGYGHTCVRLEDGSVECWGDLKAGRRDSLRDRPDYGAEGYSRPTEIERLGRTSDLSAGDHHNCAIVEDGAIRCWGDNRHGQLGGGDVGEHVDSPVSVEGLDSAVDVSASHSSTAGHSCALTDDRDVYCWGDNSHGQLGSPASQIGERSAKPIAIGGGS